MAGAVVGGFCVDVVHWNSIGEFADDLGCALGPGNA
jgi:hypothetical protein